MGSALSVAQRSVSLLVIVFLPGYLGSALLRRAAGDGSVEDMKSVL